MYLLLNTKGVVIDIVKEEKYVTKNLRTETKYICAKNKALGVVGNNDAIYNLSAKELSPGFTSIAQVIPVGEIPEEVVPGKYKYESGSFSEYAGTAPETNATLTEKATINENAILELYDMIVNMK